jgi:hypothetical protein
VSDDYLWDGSGPPDPEVRRLERALGGLRWRQPPTAPAWARPAARPRRFGALGFLAAAATLVAALSVPPADSVPRPGWDVSRLAGTARVGGAALAERGRLSVGDWLDTDAVGRALVQVGEIGEVEVGPRSRVALLDAGARHHRLAMSRGRMRATIWAPPGKFYVETPGATAIDMGCAYTLEVDDNGAGVLRVEHGWVGFEWQGKESFVPEGARCLTRPGIGPGTPFREEAPAALSSALVELDFGPPRDGRRGPALASLLAAAEIEDAFTLWHLLTRVRPEERASVHDRLAALAPPPPGVERAAVLRGERGALDLWWDSLGLGTADWWRVWKQAPPSTSPRAGAAPEATPAG